MIKGNRNLFSLLIGLCYFILLILSLVSVILTEKEDKSTLNHKYREEFERKLSIYEKDKKSKEIIDQIQVSYKCCGSTNVLDYKNKDAIPKSCCISDHQCS